MQDGMEQEAGPFVPHHLCGVVPVFSSCPGLWCCEMASAAKDEQLGSACWGQDASLAVSQNSSSGAATAHVATLCEQSELSSMDGGGMFVSLYSLGVWDMDPATH